MILFDLILLLKPVATRCPTKDKFAIGNKKGFCLSYLFKSTDSRSSFSKPLEDRGKSLDSSFHLGVIIGGTFHVTTTLSYLDLVYYPDICPTAWLVRSCSATVCVDFNLHKEPFLMISL